MEEGSSGKNLASDPLIDDARLFQTIVESIASAVFIFQGERIRYVNLAAQALSGYSKNELLMMPFWAVIHEDFQDAVKQRGRSRQDGDEIPASYEVKIACKDGEARWVNFHASMIELEGKPAVLGISEDINDRKHAEEDLQASEIQFRQMYEAYPDAIMLLGEHGFLDCNSATLAMFACATTEDFLGRHPSEYSPPTQPDGRDSREAADEKIINAYQVGSNLFEWTHQRANGEVFPAEVQLTRLQLKNGSLLQASVRDITERRKVEAHINQTADILEMVAIGQPSSNIYDAIARLYEARHPGMRCSMLELEGHKLIHGGAPSLPKAYCEAVHGLQNGPEVGSCGTSTYTGKRVLVEDIATDPKWADLKSVALPHGLRSCWSEPIKDATGKVLGAFGMYYNHPALPSAKELMDLKAAARLAGVVMEREKNQVELRKMSHVITYAGSSIMITNRVGIIEYVNPAFEKMTGYSAEEVVGQTPGILKNGNQDDDYYKKLWESISSGNTWNGRVVDKRKDGSLFPAVASIAPIMNNEGIISHFVGSHADISELEDMEKQFQQAQKMEAIGTLVGGIAHDFNNMLAGITGNLYLMKETAQENPAILHKIASIEEISYRAADMIQQLLTFARKGQVSIKPMPLSPFIKDSLKFLRTTIPESINVEQYICSDRLQINGDTTQLHQVLMNLISNARDALKGVGDPCITIRLEAFWPDESFIETYPYFKPGVYAHLSVEDNGSGIPEHQIEHLFEPFFTTKEQGKGTGLGLAMVFGAVKTHEGYVEVESTAGKGTIFHIYIALLRESEITSAGSPEENRGQGTGELILLADDEADVRETTAEVLESMGYKVLLAEDGLKALEMFKAHQDDIALALLDVVMPHCGGLELSKRIREIQPTLPIIFVTGYDKDQMLNSGEHVQNSKTLSKPVKFDTLSHLIRGLLDSS